MTTIKVVPNVVNGHTFTVSERYSFTESKILGRGSFGVVATVVDVDTNRTIAVKRIRPYANDEWDARHTLREIRLMRILGPHPNIISLYGLSSFEEKAELYMMMELMDCDLHRVIQSKQTLTVKHHKCFIKQILEGIKAMHDVGVFHRDLKPGNILVSKDCQVRITDFGLARFMDDSTRNGTNKLNPMTEYVVTRWYRAPELLLSPSNPYDEAIDIWSVGCILAELFRRKPLFPGKSHANQVQLIFEVFGYDSNEDIGIILTDEAAQYLEKRCSKFQRQPLSNVVPTGSPEAIELLERLFSINPSKRPSAHEALQSSFLKDADVICDYNKKYIERPLPEEFEFEHEKYSLEELREMILSEVRYYETLAMKDLSPESKLIRKHGFRYDTNSAENGSEITSALTGTQHKSSGNEFSGPASQLPTSRVGSQREMQGQTTMDTDVKGGADMLTKSFRKVDSVRSVIAAARSINNDPSYADLSAAGKSNRQVSSRAAPPRVPPLVSDRKSGGEATSIFARLQDKYQSLSARRHGNAGQGIDSDSSAVERKVATAPSDSVLRPIGESESDILRQVDDRAKPKPQERSLVVGLRPFRR